MNCPRCHAPIPADGPAGMCPKCLLSVGLGEPEVVLTAAGEPAPPPPTPAELQPHFPQLEIVRLVGRGGMGAVYEARQKGLGRSVALKILAAPKSADSSFEERFVREAQALARLSHENIVAVYDAGRAGPHFYLSMEYVDGPNLRQAERAGRIEPAQAIAIVMQICAALDYAHKCGIVHRDIKPENVLLTREGRVKIVDFGLAKVLNRAARGLSLTRLSQTMGTPHYMAPEQIEHPKDVDHRADIYSLGVVFYELLTGELPLGRFPLPSQRVQIDVRLDDIVIRALEKEPDRRYQAASEVRTAVQDVSDTPPPVAVAAEKPRRLRERVASMSPWATVGCVVLVLVIGAVVAGGVLMALLLTPVGIVTPPSPMQAAQNLTRIDLTPGSEARSRVVEDAQQQSDRAPQSALKALSMKEFGDALARSSDETDRVRALDALMTISNDEAEGRQYLEHEAAHATILPLANDREVAAVRFDPDPTAVQRFRSVARDNIELFGGALPEESRPSAEQIDWLVREHMPFDGPVEVRIERGASQWIVTRTMPGRAPIVDEFEHDLPIAYRRWIARQREILGSDAPPWPDGADPLTIEIATIPDPIRIPPGLSRAEVLPVWNRARDEMRTSGREILELYQRAQAGSATNAKLVEECEVARLHIAAFPATHAALVLALRVHLARMLSAKDVQLLTQLDFERAVFPFGQTDVDVSICEEDGLWSATINGDGSAQSSFGMTEPNGQFARLLALYRANR